MPPDRPVKLARHGDHDPSLTCRPALGYGLCEVLEPGGKDENCTCPHDWRSTPLDLTAAGHQPRPIKTWTRLLTVKTCPEHGERSS